MRDLGIRSTISRLDCLEKDVSESYQTRDEFYNYGRATWKRSRHYTLSIQSSDGIAINLCMGPLLMGF
jgi:hypothetical protein